MKLILAVALVVACGGHREQHAGAGSGSAVVAIVVDAGSGVVEPAVALGSDGFPLACGEWRSALDKLETCTALPAGPRDALKAVYADKSKNWGQLPADEKKRLGPICQAGADSILKGAKATCGW